MDEHLFGIRIGALSALTALTAMTAMTTMTMASAAWAQSYPNKPVRVLVSGGAGGPNDVQNRAIAQILSTNLDSSRHS